MYSKKPYCAIIMYVYTVNQGLISNEYCYCRVLEWLAVCLFIRLCALVCYQVYLSASLVFPNLEIVSEEDFGQPLKVKLCPGHFVKCLLSETLLPPVI